MPTAEQVIRRQLNQAVRLDPGLKPLLNKLGYPEARSNPPGFSTLLRIIVSQQLSTGVASSIWAKLEKICRGEITRRKIINRSEAELRACGLSKQKIGYAKGLAQMVATGELDLAGLADLAQTDAARVITELTHVRGIGVWSAEIYLMFALGHPDIFPSGDLALRVAVQRYHNLPERISAQQTAELAEKWSPVRSSVAVLMWKYYGATTLDN